MQNVESEPYQHVEILCPDLIEGFFRETMDEFFPDRFDLDAFDPGQEIGTIALVQRMILWLHALIETKVEVVQNALPQPGIKKPFAQAAEWTTVGTGGLLRWRFAVDEQFDPGEVAGLDVLDNLGAEERELRAIQQHACPELGPVRRRERPWIDPQRRDCGLATVGTADFWRPGFAEDMHGNVKAGAGNHPYSASRRPIIGLTILPEASF